MPESDQIPNALSRPEELARAHWAYIEQVVRSEREFMSLALDPSDEYLGAYLKLLGFHYRTAFIHGYGHGREDAEHEKRTQPALVEHAVALNPDRIRNPLYERARTPSE